MKFKYYSKGKFEFGNIEKSILASRGIDNIDLFLNPTTNCIESEDLFENIVQAKDCLVKHIDNKSKVVIIVDTDVDGYTSSALIYQYIKQVSPTMQLDYIIHDGKEHGLDKKTLDSLLNSAWKLVIIPDAGTNDISECQKLKNAGIDIIVLDHHIQSQHNPYAIIVNNQSSLKVTDKAMTGVGVVYKFCKMLDKHYQKDFADDYLDLVALGMIADSCDLKNLQSRYLVLKGLQQINNEVNRNLFVTQLAKSQAYSIGKKNTIISTSFYIAPLINSLIRIGSLEDKTVMFEAFCGLDRTIKTKVRGKGEIDLSIQEAAVRLCESSKRKQQKIITDTVSIMDEQIAHYQLDQYMVLVCKANASVDKNFTGLIANKLASSYKRPCLLLRESPDGSSCDGSGRGYHKGAIKNLNQWCKDTNLFNHVEGHNQAFGVGIDFDKIENLYVLISKMQYDNTLTYQVDFIFNDTNINGEIIKKVHQLSDVWGTTVYEPTFAVENMVINVKDIMLLGKNKNTLKFVHHNIEFITFKSSEEEYQNIISMGESIKFIVVGRFSVNEFDGKKIPQIMMEDFMFQKSDIVKRFVF